MKRAEVVAGLLTYLEREFPGQGTTLTETTDLLDEWFVDSFGIVQVVMFIETEYDIPVSRADINGQNFKSVSTLADFVTNRSS